MNLYIVDEVGVTSAYFSAQAETHVVGLMSRLPKGEVNSSIREHNHCIPYGRTLMALRRESS